MVAAEAVIDSAKLLDDIGFASLGVNSLLSLVIVKKFRDKLGTTANGSQFVGVSSLSDVEKLVGRIFQCGHTFRVRSAVLSRR